jgi:hypothetical protein
MDYVMNVNEIQPLSMITQANLEQAKNDFFNHIEPRFPWTNLPLTCFFRYHLAKLVHGTLERGCELSTSDWYESSDGGSYGFSRYSDFAVSDVFDAIETACISLREKNIPTVPGYALYGGILSCLEAEAEKGNFVISHTIATAAAYQSMGFARKVALDRLTKNHLSAHPELKVAGSKNAYEVNAYGEHPVDEFVRPWSPNISRRDLPQTNICLLMNLYGPAAAATVRTANDTIGTSSTATTTNPTIKSANSDRGSRK